MTQSTLVDINGQPTRFKAVRYGVVLGWYDTAEQAWEAIEQDAEQERVDEIRFLRGE